MVVGCTQKHDGGDPSQIEELHAEQGFWWWNIGISEYYAMLSAHLDVTRCLALYQIDSAFRVTVVRY